MRKLIKYLLIPLLVSCSSATHVGNKDVITVSISPFKYFIDVIGGGDFDVNVMVPAGADPHIYEPAPGQITSLSRSVAYLSDGYLGFEVTWLDRFFEANKKMKKVSMAQNIDLIKAQEHHSGGGEEGDDPHYWASPKSAYIMAANVKSLLMALKPANSEKYEKNYSLFCDTIALLDKKARTLFSGFEGKPFMIFHPALGYLARDYNLVQIAVENEGKEPSHPLEYRREACIPDSAFEWHGGMDYSGNPCPGASAGASSKALTSSTGGEEAPRLLTSFRRSASGALPE